MNDVSSSDMVVIDPHTALDVFTKPSAIDPLLQRVRDEIDAFKGDVSTAAGRKAIASMAYKVARAKTYIDTAGKELVEKYKEIPKSIDATRANVRKKLDAWRDEVRAPLDQWEAAEAKRIADLKERLEPFHVWATQTDGVGAAALRFALAEAEAIKIGDDWQEFAADAAKAKDNAIATLRSALTAAEHREADAAELARLRAEAAARERQDREERIAREAAERAKRESEDKAAAERNAVEDAANRERAAAEKRELELKLQAEQAERRAADAEAKAKREADAKAAHDAAELARREADTKHRAGINRAALDAFVDAGIDESTARRVVELIAQKKIAHVRISY